MPPKRKRGIEWIPWAELTTGQKIGRIVAAFIVVIVLFSVVKRVTGPSGREAASNEQQSAAEARGALSESDRKDGIVSLCKVFQIYGMPKNDDEAAAAARNAAELFKLAGNEGTDRSLYILDTLAHEFSSGKLKSPDCTVAGEPLPTSGTANGATDATP